MFEKKGKKQKKQDIENVKCVIDPIDKQKILIIKKKSVEKIITSKDVGVCERSRKLQSEHRQMVHLPITHVNSTCTCVPGTTADFKNWQTQW
jgi:hypothetical protein